MNTSSQMSIHPVVTRSSWLLSNVMRFTIVETGIVLALSQHRQHWASLSLHNVRQQQNGGLALQIFTQSQSDFRPHLFNAIFLLASPREGIKASLGPVKASLRGLGEWLRLSCASLCWRSLHRVDALQMPVLFSSLNAGLYRWACMLSYQLGPEEGSLCWLHHGLWVEKSQELTTHCEVAKVNIKHCTGHSVVKPSYWGKWSSLLSPTECYDHISRKSLWKDLLELFISCW